jgi:hypothetical protein
MQGIEEKRKELSSMIFCEYITKVRSQKKCNKWPSEMWEVISYPLVSRMVLCQDHQTDLQQKNPSWKFKKLAKVDRHYEYEERAAIKEYDGNMPRAQAEKEARENR